MRGRVCRHGSQRKRTLANASMQIHELRFLPEKCADALRDVVNGQLSEPLFLANCLTNGLVQSFEVRRCAERPTGGLQPPFGILEQRLRYQMLVRMLFELRRLGFYQPVAKRRVLQWLRSTRAVVEIPAPRRQRRDGNGKCRSDDFLIGHDRMINLFLAKSI